MHRIRIIIVILGITLSGVLFGTNYAQAASGHNWCDEHVQCLAAWGGGPFVKSYYDGGVNEDFTVIGNYGVCNGGYTTSTCPGNGVPAGDPVINFEFTGGGSWNGKCIGDAYNDPKRADTSLDTCYSGWGVNMVEGYQQSGCPAGSAVFYDMHWGGGPFWNPDSPGEPVYLNSNPSYCLHIPSGH